MKSIAADRLRHDLDHEIAAVHIDTRYVGDRLPDVLVEFEEPVLPYGRGIAIECQYRNESKDWTATEEAYLGVEITTLWLEEGAFDLDKFDVDLSDGTWVPVWPNAVPEDREWSGLAYDSCRRGDEHNIWTRADTGESFEYYSFPVETTVPATFHLNRWVRDRDELPSADQWGMDAVIADYGFGSGLIHDVSAARIERIDPPTHRQYWRPDRTIPNYVTEGRQTATVLATFHLDRWVRERELDELPPVGQWGLTAAVADYAVGSEHRPPAAARFATDVIGWDDYLRSDDGDWPAMDEAETSQGAEAVLSVEWWRDELRAAYEWGREIASLQALLARFDELAPYDLRCPPHPLSVARDRVASGRICEPDEHDWIELDDYYWWECRSCGLADVTVADLGQPVETPNVE